MTLATATSYPKDAFAAHKSRMAESPEPRLEKTAGPGRAKPANDPPLSAQVSPGQGHFQIPHTDRPLRILVAEDNFANQLIAKTLLTRAGFSVLTVDDGAQAAEVCAREKFDVILMDIEMPQMSGIEATQAIRASGGPNVATLIIALTAFGSATERYVYRHSGINHILSKPFKIAHLEALLGRPAPQAVPAPPQTSGPPPLIDEETLQALLDAAGSTGLISVIRAYWRSAYALLADIQDAQQRFDRDTLQKSAHALKGASVNIGLPAISGLATQLQNAKTEDAPHLLERLEICMAKSRKAMTLRLAAES